MHLKVNIPSIQYTSTFMKQHNIPHNVITYQHIWIFNMGQAWVRHAMEHTSLGEEERDKMPLKRPLVEAGEDDNFMDAK